MAHATGGASQARTGVGDGRLVTLDGLRGLAALVVVVHHGLLTWQTLMLQYGGANRASGTWWLTFTPLHLAWAGTEAVMVFFVLSGLVLALPFLDRSTSLARWRGYYGQRLVRLYVPVVAALAVAAALVIAFPRVPGPTTSWWFDAHALTVDARTLATDALLVTGVSWIDPSLWSLQYEVLFSLLLPVYVLVARRLGGWSGLLVPPLVVLAAVGAHEGNATLAWLPVFGIGVAMAAARHRLLALGARVAAARWSAVIWALLAGVTVVLLLAEWWARGLDEVAPLPMAVARGTGVVGAALVVLLAMTWPAFGALCCWRPVQWLGTISFSLYLVHEPVLVSVSSLVGGSKRGVAVTLVVGIALSLLLAVVFHRLVEAPSQSLARRCGQLLRGRTGSSADRVPSPRTSRPSRTRLPVGVGHPVAAPRAGRPVPGAPPTPRLPVRSGGIRSAPTRPVPVQGLPLPGVPTPDRSDRGGRQAPSEVAAGRA